MSDFLLRLFPVTVFIETQAIFRIFYGNCNHPILRIVIKSFFQVKLFCFSEIEIVMINS